MVIYSQNRQKVFNASRKSIMVEDNKVVSGIRIKETLGEYQEDKRAVEVLHEIFQCIRNRKGSYVMPVE
jgi:hypothetical protein